MFSNRVIRAIVICLVAVLVVLQFFRPEKNNSGYGSVTSFEAETKPSHEVSSILKDKCYDCHSNQTRYPWYAEIAPFSLWLNNHIVDGKKHLNFSKWNEYPVKRKDHKLDEIIKSIKKGEMPLKSYTFLHGSLKENEKKLLIQWAGLARLKYKQQLEVSLK